MTPVLPFRKSRASPKSMTTTFGAAQSLSPEIITFGSLMSQCMHLLLCRYRMPAYEHYGEHSLYIAAYCVCLFSLYEGLYVIAIA